MTDTPRLILPIVDQHGKQIGTRHTTLEELLTFEAHVDENGTAWTQPTGWAYMQTCASRNKLADLLEHVGRIAKDNAYGSDHIICHACSDIHHMVEEALGRKIT